MRRRKIHILSGAMIPVGLVIMIAAGLLASRPDGLDRALAFLGAGTELAAVIIYLATWRPS